MRNARAILALRSMAFCLGLLVFLLVGSCGKSKGKAPTVGFEPPTKSGQHILGRRKIPPLDELLRQLENLRKPSKADRRIWAKLKAEMRRWLFLGYA